MYNVATCYFNGVGVEKDVNTALSAFKESADNNCIYAQRHLGVFYITGNVTTNYIVF